MDLVLDVGFDILVIQGMVISVEYVFFSGHVFNFKEFVRELLILVVFGGCASYLIGLHLMRIGAVGVFVGVGFGVVCITCGVFGIGVL